MSARRLPRIGRGRAWSRGLAAVLLLFAAAAQAQGVYKWTDAQGRVHFSDAPPPGQKANKLDIRPSTPEPTTPVQARSWQEQLEQANERREREQAEAARHSQAEEQRCLSAQRSLDVLMRSRLVYSVNAQGEREYLEDGRRQAEIDAARQRVEAHCRR